MAISVVQTAVGASGAAPVFGANVAPTSTVFEIIAFYSALPDTVSAITLGSNAINGTQQLLFPQDAGAGSPQGLLIAMLPNVQVVGQTTVPFTTAGSVVEAQALEVAGLGPNPFMDVSVSAHGASATIATGSTPNTTFANELILCGAATYNGSTSAPSQSGWTQFLGLGGHLSTGYQIQTASGQSYAWTQACGAAIGWAAGIVCIAPSPGVFAAGIV